MELLTTGQVAQALGTSPFTVRRLIENGHLPAQRLHATAQYRVLMSALEDYAERNRIILALPPKQPAA